ncbi:hypothetical protein J1N35_010330 [Gossypium stocksii]|uniref:Uncharacterized protein n=1 Tax=Gossypium stocksii TaxID=47602 RepID=A0A9D3W0X2_9ROSI|nr:hypothetical protein J1N35_010330 [Gossypium stocksii]
MSMNKQRNGVNLGMNGGGKWEYLGLSSEARVEIVGPHSAFTLGSCKCPSILIIISSESSMNKVGSGGR